MQENSIFKQYYQKHKFIDRFAYDELISVSVIIPIIHVNELFEVNLCSIYREIPVKELLIGNGGMPDAALEIINKFPRVRVLDHTKYISLGYSIKQLIYETKTDIFVYIHSDVYLPNGWFDEMYKFKDQYEWYGCRMRQTLLIEYDSDYGERPYAGSQIGKKSAFLDGLKNIDDDYIYRQEDFVFSNIIKQHGYREGKIDTIFHYHQTMSKPSTVWNPSKYSISINSTLKREQDARVWEMQFKGIVKYLQPDSKWLINDAAYGIARLDYLNYSSIIKSLLWVKNTNRIWLKPLLIKILYHNIRLLYSRLIK